MKFTELLQSGLILSDGAMGTMLQKHGLLPGESTEEKNITAPEIITAVHKAYFDAGANIVSTNTFGVNTLKYNHEHAQALIAAAVKNAAKAKALSTGKQEKLIALNVGPLGKMLKPWGDFPFEKAVEIFAETIKIGVKYDVDLIYLETFNDLYEAKAALLAAKENSHLPVMVSCAYGEDKKLMTGADPLSVIATLEGLGADVIGVNCSFGPDTLLPVIDDYLKYASVPVLFKPNAGLPNIENGETVYDITPDRFAETVLSAVNKGVRLVGGCCGTTPEHIALLHEGLINKTPTPLTQKNDTVVASYNHAVVFGKKPVMIGERINPTGKKRFRQALIEGDIPYILQEGMDEQDAGADILDVNVGIPDIDEIGVLQQVVSELQTVVNLPLQIDTSDALALESALRIYNGKALINSVNGKKSSMETVFPLAKKYGGVIVALTLDENGIPDSPSGRLKIAENILKTAEHYGIDKKNIIFDTLVMTVSTDANAAKTTLDALKQIRSTTGCHTVLGISNVSFGLPERGTLNAAFLTGALSAGLSAAIVNPKASEIKNAFLCFNALNGWDKNFRDYISGVTGVENEVKSPATMTLSEAVEKGMKEQAGELCRRLLQTVSPLTVIENDLIPALDRVGKAYEEKKAYLPQLLMSAEAAKSAFDVIKEVFIKTDDSQNSNTVVLATVKGDIHDIGKNIVRLLLENYGFRVVDLGKDVSPETIVETVVDIHAPLCGLSALMTTTVPAMEETVRLLKKTAPFCRTIVGGAVLNETFAKKMNADYYAPDAMATVRIAKKISEETEEGRI